MTEEMNVNFEFENAARFRQAPDGMVLLYKDTVSINPDNTNVFVHPAVWMVHGPKFVVGGITSDGECIALIDYPEDDLRHVFSCINLIAAHIAIRLGEVH